MQLYKYWLAKGNGNNSNACKGRNQSFQRPQFLGKSLISMCFFKAVKKKHCDIDAVNCLTSYQYILKTFVTDIYYSSFTSYRYILQCGKLTANVVRALAIHNSTL